jgi:hypothetical protein
LVDGIRHGGPYPFENYSADGYAVFSATNGLIAAGTPTNAIFLADGLEVCIATNSDGVALTSRALLPGGNNSSTYFGLWTAGNNFAICAWSRGRHCIFRPWVIHSSQGKHRTTMKAKFINGLAAIVALFVSGVNSHCQGSFKLEL